MLYNVLPPLIFFLSFAGIIVLVSRVVMRSRREAFSQNMRMQAHSTSATMPEGLLNPGVANVLLKSRAALMIAGVKNTFGNAKEYFATRQERKALRKAERLNAKQEAAAQKTAVTADEIETRTQGISIPGVSWREKALGTLKGTTQSFSSALQKAKAKVPTRLPQIKTASVPLQEAPTPASVKSSPQIRIIRVDTQHADAAKTSSKQVEIGSSSRTTTEAPQGRFIARLKKPQPPKATILEQVNDAIGAGQLEQAEEMLIPYIVKHAKDCEAYMLLGKVAIAKGAWTEAMEVFQQVIHLDPDVTDAQASLGYAALQQGKFSIALQALQRAHRADPENVQILDQLLNIARRLDNKVLQKSVLEQLIELQPENKKAAEHLQALLEAEKTRQSN